jgi:hypothetical protein
MFDNTATLTSRTALTCADPQLRRQASESY